jgi:hypothetical protein
MNDEQPKEVVQVRLRDLLSPPGPIAETDLELVVERLLDDVSGRA